MLLGRGPLDPVDREVVLVDLREGDAIVLPAGVAHCSMNTFSSRLIFYSCLLCAIPMFLLSLDIDLWLDSRLNDLVGRRY